MDCYMEEAQLICRLCTENLLQFEECYSIDEEVEQMIFNLTTISVMFCTL